MRFPVPVHFLRLPILMFILVASRSVAGSQEDKTEERIQNRGEKTLGEKTRHRRERHMERRQNIREKTLGEKTKHRREDTGTWREDTMGDKT